jgi:dynein heavy chain
MRNPPDAGCIRIFLTFARDNAQIDRFEQMHQEAEKVETQMTFQSWFLVNLKPFRQSLLNCIRKWSFMFKQYLISTVTDG